MPDELEQLACLLHEAFREYYNALPLAYRNRKNWERSACHYADLSENIKDGYRVSARAVLAQYVRVNAPVVVEAKTCQT